MFGPRSEEGSDICEVQCMRGKEPHGPYVVSNVSSPDSYEVRGTFLNGKRDGRWIIYGQNPESLERTQIEETNYHDGVAHGAFRRWHPDGTLQQEGAYVREQRDGAWVSFAPDGSWTFKGSYDNGVPIGTHRERYINGQLAAQKAYDEMGRPHGQWCFWLSDGTEVDCFEIQFGSGEVREYDRDGKLTQRIELVDGRRHGTFVEHTHDGGRYEAQYVDGQQHGEERVFDGDCVTRSVMWDQGKEHGPTVERDCESSPPREVVTGEHCHGHPCGKWTMRDEQGRPTQILEFSETGEVLGRVTYDEDGEIEDFSSGP